MKLEKTFYGTIQELLLFWKNLTATLKEDSFEVNPYDWCIANEMVDGKQLTIVWYVGILKISHESPEVVTSCINMLDEKYGYEAFGKRSPLTVKHSRKYKYPGMLLDYSKSRKVKIDMHNYISTFFDKLPSDYDGQVVSPAESYLFNINEQCKKLSTLLTNYCFSAKEPDQTSKQP